MTFPVIASTGTSSPASSTSWVVTLPASIAAGDLLLAFIQANGADVLTVPTGWTSLFNPADSTFVMYKYASGSEGASVTITGGSSRSAAAVVYRITGTDGVTAPSIGTAVATSTSTFDPPSLTPSWGSADTLWFAVAGARTAVTVSTAPTSYTLQNSQISGGSNAYVHIYTRTNTTATEDPSAYTLSGVSNGYGITVGVRPAANNVGAISASAVVAGVGAATASAVGAISASSVVAGVGKATTNAVGSIAASGADTGVGASIAAGVGLIAATGAFFAVAAAAHGVISVTASVVGVGASIAAAVGAIAASSGGAGTGVGLAQAIGMVSANAYVASVGAATFSGVGQISAVSVLVPAVFMEYADAERAWVTWQSNKVRLEFENRSFRVAKRTDIQERSNLRTIHVIPRLRK